ncbi:MAG: MarR family transcriptional regulator [Firmicutes bacterium]|nr:MarR family transcriptional regulator [Bacillota bacterium]NBI64612.1 MarR family transcriptional regulator [Clostridiales bacterium]
MDENVKKINSILVNLFNMVLKLEEKAIKESTRRDLSLTELHTLVAIGEGKAKTMSQVAASLKISVSTLTTAVNRLVKKGYAHRFRIPEDRRIVKVELTEIGIEAVREHEAFHTVMISEAISQIPEDQIGKFIDSIDNINEYLLMRKHPPARTPGPFTMKPLKLGRIFVPVPLFQGALSIGLSKSRLASAVAKEGGVGIIAASKIGYQEHDFQENPVEANKRVLRQEIKKALDLTIDCKERGPIGVNIMWSSHHCEEYVKAAVSAGAELIVCGGGIPTKLPAYCRDKKVALVPIVSSKRAANIIIRNWTKKYNRTPDGFIFQGPLAGGYLGIKESQMEAAAEDFYKNIADIKGELEDLGDCPLIVCGGIYTRSDAEKAYAYGADGFQLGTRFVTTQECDASEAFKQAYLNCREQDITIITSPEGFPGRVIENQCVPRVSKEPWRIMEGLLNASRGDLEHGLIFCGGKIHKAEKIETVADIFREFTEGACQ